ncbi:MAG TPA: NADH-quinone oxidoreductase subunit H [Nitrososphaerales archaeon]|nr:NADH-quinone oxidoreductase subunit H [Nitrososphaerales archaeon]
MTSFAADLMGGLQLVAVFALAPLLTGIMRKVKARTQKRLGASVFQPYYELSKLWAKDEVVSEHSSWIFRSTPWIVAVATITAALFIPVFVPFSPFSAAGDVLLVIGLLALARFFTMLAGIDAASAFGGIGTSREMMTSSLVEPGLFLTIFVVSLTLGGTNLTGLVGAAARSGAVIAPSMLFGLISFFVIVLAETGRLPFDNPATHLELTMVHEAMVLEYSGRSLALIEWSQATKQLVLLALLVDLFLPLGMPASINASLPLLGLGALAVLLKVALLAAAVAFVETRVAKWRLFRVPDLLVVAIAVAMVGMIFFYL